MEPSKSQRTSRATPSQKRSGDDYRVVASMVATLSKFPPVTLQGSIGSLEVTARDGTAKKNYFIQTGGTPPLAMLAATPERGRTLVKRREQQSSTLSPKELLMETLPLGITPITPFRHNILAEINNAFYRAPCVEPTNQSYLRTSLPLRNAIASHINKLGQEKTVHVKEFAAGEGASRWGAIDPLLQNNVQVTLSDLTPPAAVSSSRRVTYATIAEDIYSPLKRLPPEGLFDVILGTYWIDTLSFPRDRFFIKQPDGSWYCSVTRLVSTDTRSKQNHSTTSSTSPCLEFPDRAAVLNINYDTISYPYPVSKMPHGELIQSYYAGNDVVAVPVPFGLVKKLKEIVYCQLRPGGSLILIDVGIPRGASPVTPPFIIQQGVPFRFLDLRFLGELLRAEGLNVSVEPLESYITSMGITLDAEYDRLRMPMLEVVRISH